MFPFRPFGHSSTFLVTYHDEKSKTNSDHSVIMFLAWSENIFQFSGKKIITIDPTNTIELIAMLVQATKEPIDGHSSSNIFAFTLVLLLRGFLILRW